ncbi:hypothetical protein FIBSPDRAFT_1049937 [Athelia psychrophila]|uniref:Uncharacterized protein n=1 Tax=Athelia psychrophila TaxID=1759441 RepID=A0A166BDN2_9AGAM|nr:hypothetical protein FIBSPDRAFT_1049937 [Fibularhizoctonia sp. CBS 109695]
MSAPAIINVHTPTASFAIVHSVNEETLDQLFDKLTRKSHTDFQGMRVGPGWVKYQFGDTFWNLDDDADYTIFVWRQKSAATAEGSGPSPSTPASPVGAPEQPQEPRTPTLQVHNPALMLPPSDSYRNSAFYLFQHPPAPAHAPGTGSVKSARSKAKSAGAKSKKEKEKGAEAKGRERKAAVPKHKTDFEKFHSENGVRTVMGSIGPVHNVRMLLKAGYRHVYISRKFAMKHGFIPRDASPGNYGYSGLVNIGTWPVTLQPLGAASLEVEQDQPGHRKPKTAHHDGAVEPKSTPIAVYLSEEPHFDVVLGRSFFEKRQIKTDSTDPTEVVCLDTGERVEVEVVVLKDGRGEIVIVT